MKAAFSAILVLTSFYLHAQPTDSGFPTTNPSPPGTIVQMVGNTSIGIEYERPLARKRQVFGDLVPWAKVWRTGAGHCTKIKFDKQVIVEGQRVAAGHYSLFTIPGPHQWVIILNADTSLYGSYGYDVNKDVARFVVASVPTERHYEALTIDIDLVQTNAKIYISWTNVQVGFAVETTTQEDVMKFIGEKLFTGASKNSDAYYAGAEFLLFQKEHLMDALKLAQKAIQLDKDNGGARRVKIEIYEFLQLYDEALHEIKLALEMEKNKKYEKEEERKLEIAYWQRFQDRIKAMQESKQKR